MINEILDNNFDQYKIIGRNYTVLNTKTIVTSFINVTKTWYFNGLLAVLVVLLMLSIIGTLFHRDPPKPQIDGTYVLSSSKFRPNVHEMFSCFSIKCNIKSVFEINESEMEPFKEVIHGLRAVSVMYMILAHIGLFAMYFVDNGRECLKHINEVLSILIFNAPVCADVFFAMSGFLSGIGVINAEKRQLGFLMIFGVGSLRRYLR